jgi:hypothetical protein
LGKTPGAISVLILSIQDNEYTAMEVEVRCHGDFPFSCDRSIRATILLLVGERKSAGGPHYAALYPNHIWSIDFVHDKLSAGRPFEMLTLLDE